MLHCPENVAQERRFYEIVPLTKDELGLIEACIEKSPKENHSLLKSKLQNLIDYSSYNDNTRKNALEDEYADMERKTIPILQSLRKGSIDILDNEYDKIIFSIFTGMQYTILLELYIFIRIYWFLDFFFKNIFTKK